MKITPAATVSHTQAAWVIWKAGEMVGAGEMGWELITGQESWVRKTGAITPMVVVTEMVVGKIMKTEREIEKEIIDHFKQSPDKYYILKIRRGGTKSMRGLPQNTGSGVSDLIVFVNIDQTLIPVFLEVKTAIGKQLPSQIKFAEDIAKLGGQYFIVRSLVDAVECIYQVNVLYRK